jgi:two-component system chemotaxis sensor kinase CheA
MDELVSEFVEETSESLAELDNEVVRLESNPDDDELVGSIFRLVHTIKGTCGFLGLPRLESVAHSAEDVLGLVRDKTLDVTPDVVSIILEAFDHIKGLMEYLEENGQEPEGDDSELISRLDAVAAIDGAPTEADFNEAMESISDAPTEDVLTEDENVEGASEGEPMETSAEDNPEADPETSDAQAEEASSEGPASAGATEDAVPEPVKEETLPEQVQAQAVQEGLKAEVKEKPAAKKAGSQSIRVNIDTLEELMQSVSELVLTRNQLSQMARENVDSEFITPIQRLNHITTELQEGIMKTRMQPIGNAFAKFPRLVRDLSIELEKKVNLRMTGEETELDRQLSEVIKDPLTHMVRNSVDHGLEKPADRLAAGKSEEGEVLIAAYHEGGHIIIEIKDDGKGIDPAVIKAKALEKGLATEQELAEMSDQRIMQFIFNAGFSTAEKVTNVSGRGVGMDVVRAHIEKIGGTVELNSELGKGSRFRIKIPLTLAIVSVLIVEAEGQRFSIPQINVVEMVQIRPKSEYKIEMINHSPIMRLRDRLLPLVRLNHVLGTAPEQDDENYLTNCYVVICNVGGFDFGVVVDRVFDTEEIVVKPVAPILQDIDLYGGCTILGDGSVIMILDPNGLARRTGDVHTENANAEGEDKVKRRFAQKEIGFLLFYADGSDVPKAVPLDLVARLEEISKDRIEQQSSGSKVVQYRGEIMRLITLGGEIGEPDENGFYQVVVFNYDGRMIGLVIDQIIDTVQDRLKIKMPSKQPHIIGSMVFHDRTTEVVDTGYILSEAIGEMLKDEAGGDGENDASGRTILLVDDSPFFRNLNAPYLSARGFSVITAEGPTEAFKIMETTDQLDLIISDIEMPDMTGIEFARACRDQDNYNTIPMIAYTSNMRADMVEEGLSAGFKAYVSKTDREGLLREVASILEAANG